MVKIGDWIEMPKYGVDGDVMAISLTTIRVRNFDKTISSIPTYGILSESFKNWRGMQESGGRRIKRSLQIDLNSIKPLTPEMVERLQNIDLIRNYILDKREDLREYFLTRNVLLSPVNGRWLTNVGTFRVYLQNYLRQHSEINPELTCLVRQLQPSREGLPLEIYAFTRSTDWDAYERVQADLFDHIISILAEFGLRVFQDPTEFDYDGSEKRYGLPRIDDHVTIGITEDAMTTELKELREFVDAQNEYLKDHPRARPETAAAKVDKEILRLALAERVSVDVDGRRIEVRFV